MYKRKKIILYSLLSIYLVTFVIEIIKYLLCSSNLFGMIHNLITVFILFFFVTVSYNYKNYYSKSRVSKLMIMVVIGLFNSFILKGIVIKSMSVSDNSLFYYKDIFITNNIVKPIIYLALTIFTIIETKIITNIRNNKMFDKAHKM